MAKEDIEEVPVGELHSRLFGNPSSAVDQQPVQTNAAPLPAVPSVRQVEKSTGIKPPANVKVKDPNAEWVGKSAATAANTARENLNEVKPGSPIHSLVDEITNNWHIPALIVGGLGAAYLAKKAFGGGNPPDDNNPPNNPPRNNSERIEPTFHEPEKPALQTAQQTSETVASPETAQQLSSTEVPHTNSESITPEQMVQADKPASIPQGMTAETEVGKAPKDMGLVEAGDANRELKAADKKVIAAQKALAQQGAVIPQGMKPDYPKPKGGVGVGPYHWFENQVGVERAPSLWRELFGEKNVPLKEVQEKYKQFAQSVPEGYTPRSEEGVLSKRGGNFSKTNAVPEYIRGSAPIGNMLSLAGNALGAVELKKAYEHGKKTGDWSELGLGAINQIVGNLAPRAAVPLALMSPNNVSSGTLDTPEARELFARANAKKVGAGRGIAPPSAYQR